jgi:hypothetical protein
MADTEEFVRLADPFRRELPDARFGAGCRGVLTIAVRQSGKAPSVVETVSGSNARLTALPANGLKELLSQCDLSFSGCPSDRSREIPPG